MKFLDFCQKYGFTCQKHLDLPAKNGDIYHHYITKNVKLGLWASADFWGEVIELSNPAVLILEGEGNEQLFIRLDNIPDEILEEIEEA